MIRYAKKLKGECTSVMVFLKETLIHTIKVRQSHTKKLFLSLTLSSRSNQPNEDIKIVMAVNITDF